MSYILGIDIGGTNIVTGIVDEKANILVEFNFKTTEYPTAKDVVKAIYTKISSSPFFSKLKGIGIGAPNGNYYSGSIEFAPNMPWKGIIPLARLFEKQFQLPCKLTNDANAAALGEKKYGGAKNFSHFITITLGTGVGSGIIIDDHLVYGHDGFAGELGHFRVIPNGRTCGCGRKGCLETYTSATGVVRSVQELKSNHKETSALLQIPSDEITAKKVFELAHNGDLFAQEIVDYTAHILGNALADFATFSSPEAFVLFGGIAQNGERFIRKVKEEMEKNILIIYKDKIKVIASQLHDKNAAVLGAASLIH